MKPKERSAEFLPNAPLQEAIVSLKWALPHGVQGVRFDTELDLALGRLQSRVESAYPKFERLQLPLGLGPFQANYVPIFRLASEHQYPLIQLGSGIFTFNESGRQYDWQSFPANVASAVSELIEAYPKDYLQLVELEFLLVNRLKVNSFEHFLRDLGHFSDDRLVTSRFFKDYLNLEVSTEYQDLDLQLATQEVVRQYRTPDRPQDTIVVRHRDDSEFGGDQIAYWEIVVKTVELGLPLTEESVTTWLERVHTRTRAIFTHMTKNELIKAYFGGHTAASLSSIK